jgi:hypothetical protein
MENHLLKLCEIRKEEKYTRRVFLLGPFGFRPCGLGTLKYTLIWAQVLGQRRKPWPHYKVGLGSYLRAHVPSRVSWPIIPYQPQNLLVQVNVRSDLVWSLSGKLDLVH